KHSDRAFQQRPRAVPFGTLLSETEPPRLPRLPSAHSAPPRRKLPPSTSPVPKYPGGPGAEPPSIASPKRRHRPSEAKASRLACSSVAVLAFGHIRTEGRGGISPFSSFSKYAGG